MRFEELNKDNYLLFAIKFYDNPQSLTKEDFDNDMKRFKYVKRLLNRYKNTKNIDDLKVHLILNHLIVLFNVFNEATIPLLLYKLEYKHWSLLKTFLLFLDRYPSDLGTLANIEIEIEAQKQLEKI
jgi:hypothetical protein